MVKKKKRKSVSALKKEAWDLCSIFIRTRDCLKTTGCASWGLCVTCGKRYHFKLLQAGHFISGRFNSILFEDIGIHAQCYWCNVRLKGNTLIYRDKMIEMYGEEEVDRLRELAKQSKQYKPYELEELKEIYKKKTEEL